MEALRHKERKSEYSVLVGNIHSIGHTSGGFLIEQLLLQDHRGIQGQPG